MLQTRDLLICEQPYEKYATVYTDPEAPPKACILYFHGGGLLYGSRRDLPALHIEFLTKAGYRIVAFDYPLAPAAKLEDILEDVRASVNGFLDRPSEYAEEKLPYFLWGRSAGAYLVLLAAAGGRLQKPPAGIISYYGYGFLCDGWFLTPSKYYLSLPPVGPSALDGIPEQIHARGSLDTHYGAYVYARQSGKWLDLIYEGRLKFFYTTYTLRLFEKLPCPLFCAHSTGDTDVPYAEFLELCSRYRAQRFVASSSMHDFDRDETNPATAKLLEATRRFLDRECSRL